MRGPLTSRPRPRSRRLRSHSVAEAAGACDLPACWPLHEAVLHRDVLLVRVLAQAVKHDVRPFHDIRLDRRRPPLEHLRPPDLQRKRER